MGFKIIINWYISKGGCYFSENKKPHYFTASIWNYSLSRKSISYILIFHYIFLKIVVNIEYKRCYTVPNSLLVMWREMVNLKHLHIWHLLSHLIKITISFQFPVLFVTVCSEVENWVTRALTFRGATSSSDWEGLFSEWLHSCSSWIKLVTIFCHFPEHRIHYSGRQTSTQLLLK